MAADIRVITSADLDAADRILLAAYGGGSRRHALASYLVLQPDGWIMTYVDGAPAGVAGTINYGPTAYIGLVGVDPAYQRRGLALAMMRHLLAWLAARGNPVVLLDASVAGAPLYERLGFVDDEQTIAFVRGDHVQQPELQSAHVGTLAAADLPAVVAFDAPIFGAARAAVLGQLYAEAPARALVMRDQAGQISGYLFAQPRTIGPWAARTPAEAEALLGAALALAYDQGPSVMAPGANPHIAGLLQRYGFSPSRALRHMRLGGDGPVGRRGQLYGLASFAIG